VANALVSSKHIAKGVLIATRRILISLNRSLGCASLRQHRPPLISERVFDGTTYLLHLERIILTLPTAHRFRSPKEHRKAVYSGRILLMAPNDFGLILFVGLALPFLSTV
jgi:hypothetical protein